MTCACGVNLGQDAGTGRGGGLVGFIFALIDLVKEILSTFHTCVVHVCLQRQDMLLVERDIHQVLCVQETQEVRRIIRLSN